MSEAKFAYSFAELMDLGNKLEEMTSSLSIRQTGKSTLTLAFINNKFDTYCLLNFINSQVKHLEHKLQPGSTFSGMAMIGIIRKHFHGRIPNMFKNSIRKRLKVIIKANLNRALIKKEQTKNED